MLNHVPGKSDIIDATRRISGYVHHTPLLTSKQINHIAGCSLYFKCENFQKIGAFKARGAVNATLSLSEGQRKYGIATHSSGNHAQALAYAGSIVGIKSYIVMPENAPSIKIEAVKGYGAQIIFCKPTLKSRETSLEKVVEDTSAFFIHPYNNYSVIAGQATSAFEIFQSKNDLDYVLTPVGGGGLLSGTLLSRNYFSPGTKVIAGEPSGADDAYRSLKKGRIVPSINPDTIADGLLTSLGDKTFKIIHENIEEIIVVTDIEIIEAMKLLWERMKIIVEPSGAVPFAALLRKKENFMGKQVGIILSGGNVDLKKNYFNI
ncbi:MAG: pyridoxal-phosphate dependent enzyme [Cyclobacteriaceae bacterium]|jgi:threonine dehydratase